VAAVKVLAVQVELDNVAGSVAAVMRVGLGGLISWL